MLWNLAKLVGIDAPEARIIRLTGNHHTFLTKRFDRNGNNRIHCSLAMTLLDRYEGQPNEELSSYLEIVEFIQNNSESPKEDLHQL